MNTYKKILHIITTIEIGGAEKQLLILCRQQINDGYQVSVLWLKGKPELVNDFKTSGVRLVSNFANKSFASQLLMALFFRIKKSSRFNIVHAHLPRSEIIGAILSPKSKLIISRHNAEQFFPGSSSFLSKKLSLMIESRVSRIILCSHAVQNFYLRTGELQNASKHHIVYYGIEDSLADETPTSRVIASNSFFSKYNIPLNTKVFGTISRLEEQKDLFTLLEAYALVQVKLPSSILMIAGIGSLECELKMHSRSLGIDKKVVWLGKIENVRDFYNSISSFVLTSKYEGFGLVLLEAMFYKVPIIASNISAIPEVLGMNFPGLCSPGDSNAFSEKILKSIDSKYKANLLKLQNSNFTRFSSKTMANNINLVYDSVNQS